MFLALILTAGVLVGGYLIGSHIAEIADENLANLEEDEDLRNVVV